MSNYSADNIPNCSKYTGYKPCEPYKLCAECKDRDPVGERILVISLEAQGAVLMSTSLLHGLKEKYPDSSLTWLTRPEAMPLLANNPLIDQALPWDDENRMLLSQIEFNIILSLDKSRYAGAFINSLRAKKKFGFGLSPEGQIIPLNKGALYNYDLGLHDNVKFHQNKRSTVDILHETVELPYNREKYSLFLSKDEIDYRNRWAEKAGLSHNDIIIGFNTGCSNLFPHKKMTVEQHLTLINMLHERTPEIKMILLGGREDTERNSRIQELSKGRAINTPTTEGLRRGIVYTDLADIVISGDSLGMHLAIALNKYLIAWFGLSCAEEIDLFNRGEKVRSGVSCEPCWKKSCDDLRCIEELSLEQMYDAAVRGIDAIRAEKNSP